MKKITMLFVALVVAMATFAANLVGGTTVYLKPSSDWNQANARFAIYCWDDAEGVAWYDMQVTPNNPIIYSVAIPEGKDFIGFKFVRMNPATTENNWDNRWNETGDLTYEAETTQYNVSGWGDGSWGEYATPENCTLTLVGDNATLFGSAWSVDNTGNDMTYSKNSKKWTKNYTLDLTENLTGNYKVAYNHAWDYSWGNGDGTDGNTKLDLAISGEGKYRVTFTFDPSTKQVSATIKKLVITIVEGTELYVQIPTKFTIASAQVKFGTIAKNALTDNRKSADMTEVNDDKQIWKVVAPAGVQDSLFSVNLTNTESGVLCVVDLKYDKVNNLFVLSEDVVFGTTRRPGSATEANGAWSVYQEEIVEPEQPEVEYTIVEGTKLYLQTSVTVEKSYTVAAHFGEFEVPVLPASGGGSLRPIAPERKEASIGGGSIGGSTSTLPEGFTAMTRIVAGTEGGYDVWEIVAPEGTSTDIFTIYIQDSKKAALVYVTPLTYDGENNLFITGEDFALGAARGGRVAPSLTAECGTWGIYEVVEPEPVIEVEALYVPAGRGWAWQTYQESKHNFFAVFANAEDTAVVNMVAPYGDHVLEAIVPEGEWNTVMFCAFAGKEFALEAVVEHTGFIVPEEGMNQYTLTTKVDGVYPGTWGIYTKPEETWTLDGEGTNAEIFLKEGGKTNPENDFVETETEGIWVKEYENVELAAGTFKCMAHKYRVMNNNSIGNGTSTPDVKVVIDEAGTYDVTFTLDLNVRLLTVEVVKASASVAVENVTIENVFVQNGMIVAEEEVSIFTVTGQNVTAQNGNLKAGVYVVRTANATTKVIVK